MKSTLKNMVLVLFTITLIASAAVGAVYNITKDPIAAANAAATTQALLQVLPEFDNTDSKIITLEEMPIEVYTATKGGEVVGYAVKTMTKNGFSGTFTLMVGLTPQSEVINVNVLSHSETPGLGSKMTEPNNNLINSIKDKNLNNIKLQVSKDGGDVDALTASTITSRAYVDAIDRANRALNELLEKGGDNE